MYWLGGISNSFNQILGSEYQVVLGKGRFESKLWAQTS